MCLINALFAPSGVEMRAGWKQVRVRIIILYSTSEQGYLVLVLYKYALLSL